MKLKKIIAFVLCLTIMASLFPAAVFANETEPSISEDEFRQAISGGQELIDFFPNGVFTFIGSQFAVEENQGKFEIQIARQGGTQGQASVVLKAIDITTKYGQDYRVEIKGDSGTQVIPENPDAQSLVETIAGDDLPVVNSDDLDMTAQAPTPQEKAAVADFAQDTYGGVQAIEETDTVHNHADDTDAADDVDMIDDNQNTDVAEQADATDETGEPEINDNETDDTPTNEPADDNQQENQPADTKKELLRSGLRTAAGILTGKEYSTPNWRDIDIQPSETEMLKTEYQDYFDKAPGMETVLTFAEGEYSKTVYVIVKDDNISESDEQFALTLSKPEGGAEVGEFFNCLVNIVDDEELEQAVYNVTETKITAGPYDETVTVTVERTAGLHTSSYVTLGTASMSAKADVDYVPKTQKLIFLPEVTQQSFTVELLHGGDKTDKEFAVIITDEKLVDKKSETRVTIQDSLYSEGMGMMAFAAAAAAYTPVNQSTVVERISPKGSREGANNFVVMPADFTQKKGTTATDSYYGMSLKVGGNAGGNSWVAAPVNLYGVKKIDWTWSNQGPGSSWYTHDDWWLFGWHCSKSCKWNYSNNYNSYFSITGPGTLPWSQWSYNQKRLGSIAGAFTSTRSGSSDISPWMWGSNNLEFWLYGSDPSTMKFTVPRLYLQDYEMKILNDPNDTGVAERTVVGVDNSGQPVGKTGGVTKPLNVGRMVISGVARDANHDTGITDNVKKTVYRGDVITFKPEYYSNPATGRSYSEDVYLWGYKIRDRAGNWKTFEGTVLNLNSAWFKTNAATNMVKSEASSTLYNTALLIQAGANWYIDVRPVFKTKNEVYVKLDTQPAKAKIGGFLGDAESKVFAISRFDTLEIKATTGGNNQVYDWYVQQSTSTVSVDNISQAANFFKTKTAGSAGNTYITSSFIDSASKVVPTLNPAAKDTLTYKPTARFTHILPVFSTNTITLKENPQAARKSTFLISNYAIKKGTQNITEKLRTDLEFFAAEKAAKGSYTFSFKLTKNAAVNVPASLTYKIYAYNETGTDFVLKHQLTVNKKTGDIFEFTLNPWIYSDDAFATISWAAGSEQSVDFVLNTANFVSLNDDRENVIMAGDPANPVVYDGFRRNDVYTMSGFTNANYYTEWQNATGDLDGDGVLSDYENSLYKDYRVIDRRYTSGNTYHLKATYDMPIVYYNFVQNKAGAKQETISGKLMLADKTYLNQGSKTEKPLEGITINIAGESVTTNEKGEFSISSAQFVKDRLYSCVYVYQDYKYVELLKVGNQKILIDPFYNSDVTLSEISVHNVAANGGEALLPKANAIMISEREDRNYDFEFYIDSSRIPSTTITKAELFTRAPDGTVKAVGTINEMPGSGGRFKTQLNAFNHSVGEMYIIVPIDQAGLRYPQIPTGVQFKEDASKIALNMKGDQSIGSFPLFGGIAGSFTALDTTADQAKPMTDAQNSLLKSSKKGGMSTFAADDEDDGVERNLMTIAIGKEFGGDPDEAPTTGAKPDAPQVKVEVKALFVYSIADDGKLYFEQFALTAGVNVSGGFTLTYVTPIGIPLYATFTLSIGVSATIGIEPKEGESVPLAQMGTSDKIVGTMSVTLAVGVGVELGIGVDAIKIYLSGQAGFEFVFPILGQGSKSGKFSLSASLGIKILFFSKEWLIISKSWSLYGKSSSAARIYLNQEFAEFDEMGRDYLDNRSGWSGSGIENQGMLRAFGGATDINVEESIVRDGGAYPYPDNKLIDIGGGRALWVFVDDAGDRTARNRTAIFYSVIDETGAASQPKIIEDDGTLDESPDVFDLGDGRIAISWSDASRVFDESDSEKDCLTSMDITSCFFNKNTQTITDITAITRTTGRFEDIGAVSVLVGDMCGETNPRMAYDPETDRIVLYYTKSDYYDGNAYSMNAPEIPDGSMDDPDQMTDQEKELYIGDVLNPFSLIAYRFYENGRWNTAQDYDGDELTQIQDQIDYQITQGYVPADYTVETYKADWYGQRFLDLVMDVEVQEDITQIVVDPGDPANGLDPVITEEVRQTVVAGSPVDPRVISSANISYNGLSLFAYTTDTDYSLETENDQELYLQIYNFGENSFSHPIMLTADNVADKMPQFVRANGITYLYWLRDGSICYMDISNLIKHGLRQVELNGKNYYVIDKANDNSADTATINPGVQQISGDWGVINFAVTKEEGVIQSFTVVSDGNDHVYLYWNEYMTLLKEGTEPEQANDISNQNRESHIFVVKWEPVNKLVRTPVDYISEAGEDEIILDDGAAYRYIYSFGPGKYPDKVEHDGTVYDIDYDDFMDINGRKGLVKAGDPILKQELVTVAGAAGWGKPIQITNQTGANYNELAAVVTADGGLRIAFVKYTQSVLVNQDQVAYFEADQNNRQLGLMTVNLHEGATFNQDSLTISTIAPQAGEVVDITATVVNTGLNAIVNPTVSFYQLIGQEKTLIDTYEHGADEEAMTLPSGDKLVAAIKYTVPENQGDITIVAEVEYADVKLTAQKAFDFAIVPEYVEASYEFMTVDKVVISGTIQNNGNKSGELSIDVLCNGQVLANIPVVLNPLEQAGFIKEISLPDEYFTMGVNQNDPTILEERATLTLSLDGITQGIVIIRSATAEQVEIMENVAGFALASSAIELTMDKFSQLTPEIELADENLQHPMVKYVSLDPAIAIVDTEGRVYPNGKGTTTILAILMPSMESSIAGTLSSPGAMLNSEGTLPSALRIIKEVKVTVKAESTEPSVTPPGPSVPNETTVTGPTNPDPVAPQTNWDSTVEGSAENGAGTAQVKQSQLANLVNAITGGDRSEKSVTINVALDQPALSVVTGIENKLVKTMEAGNVVSLTINTPAGSVRLNKQQIAQLGQTGGDVIITVEQIGGQTSVRVTAGETTVAGDMIISIPYTLKDGETAERVIAKDENGNAVAWSYYDAGRACLILIASGNAKYSVSAESISFKDVVNHWGKGAIEFVAARNIFNGTAQDVFSPDQQMTRGMLVTVIGRLHGAVVDGKQSGFADVSPTAYYAQYIAWAAENKIVNGKGGNVFAPDAPVTREEMAVIIKNYADFAGISMTAAMPGFADNASIAPWSNAAVGAIAAQGIITGRPGNTFDPQGNSTRAEVATVIMRLIGLTVK